MTTVERRNWQRLVDTGDAWIGDVWTSKMAAELLEAGEIVAPR
jgi:hypothetical protein